MEREQLIKAFAATVQASLHGLQTLQPLLEQEQGALIGKDPARLNEIVQQKLALLRQLEPGIQARERLQRAAGVAAGLDGGAQLVASLAPDGLAADWDEMVLLARIVAELNDRNSQLALQGQRTIRTALEILTGRALQDETYSTLRRRSSGASCQTLGRV